MTTPRSNQKLLTYIAYIDVRKYVGKNIAKPKTFRTPIDGQLVDLYGITSRDFMQTEITGRRHNADHNCAYQATMFLFTNMFWYSTEGRIGDFV